MKILITGGTGFLGYNFYQHLRRLRLDFGGRQEDLQIWVYSRRCGGDILDYEKLSEAVKGMDLIYHFAAQTHVDFSIRGDIAEKQHFIDTNAKGTLNVLMACLTYEVKLVHVSTSEVYGTSQTPGEPMTEDHPLLGQAGTYAVSKVAGDLLCRMAYMTEGQNVVIARPFNLYGPHQSMEKLIPRFIHLASFGEPLTIYGDGEQRRDYVYAQDAAKALWELGQAPAGTIVNIGTENSFSINEIAELIIKACGDKGLAVHSAAAAARPAEVQELNGSYDRLARLTGWYPETDIQVGIEKCVDWYTANGHIAPPDILNQG
jgi:nucleoside-diphosphate-sugar epimerase